MSERSKEFHMPWGTLVALSAALGVGALIGARLSRDAIAVLLGVVAGVAAGIPTALLLMAVTRRGETPGEERYDEREPTQRAMPPVIVVAPGSIPQQLPYAIPGYQATIPGGERQFRVMGYEEDDAEPW